MKKKLVYFVLALTLCSGFAMVTTANATSLHNSYTAVGNDNGNSANNGNNNMRRNDTNFTRTAATNDDNDTDYGWIGLAGLLGLFGLKRRDNNNR